MTAVERKVIVNGTHSAECVVIIVNHFRGALLALWWLCDSETSKIAITIMTPVAPFTNMV